MDATSTHLVAVAVEDDDAPAPAVVTVVSPAGTPGSRPVVIEVAGRMRRVVLVVAYRGPGAPLVLAPGGVVAVSKLPGGAVWVDVVPQSKDGARYVAQQLRRGFVAVIVAGRDVPGPYQGCMGGPLLGQRRTGVCEQHGCCGRKQQHRASHDMPRFLHESGAFAPPVARRPHCTSQRRSMHHRTDQKGTVVRVTSWRYGIGTARESESLSMFYEAAGGLPARPVEEETRIDCCGTGEIGLLRLLHAWVANQHSTTILQTENL